MKMMEKNGVRVAFDTDADLDPDALKINFFHTIADDVFCDQPELWKESDPVGIIVMLEAKKLFLVEASVKNKHLKVQEYLTLREIYDIIQSKKMACVSRICLDSRRTKKEINQVQRLIDSVNRDHERRNKI